MKKILVVIFITILVIFIYAVKKDKKIYYFAIGDYITMGNSYNYNNYIKDYLEEKQVLENYNELINRDYRVIDIIKEIESNKDIEEKPIKNILIKSDIITLSIGYNDIIDKLSKYDLVEIHEYIDKYMLELESLYQLLREYSKETIIMIGYYNFKETSKYDNEINYLNTLSESLALKYNIYYISLENLDGYIENELPNQEGHHLIFNKVREIIDNHILN